MKSFFIDFWTSRNPNDPLRAWQKHLQLVEESNDMFATSLRDGYLTDRGRVYVEYGPPNDVIESTNASISYPYQIWHYYTLGKKQSNKRFIFFNKTGALDEYELLHSDAIGEAKNLNWQQVIKKFNKNESSIFGDFLEGDFNQ